MATDKENKKDVGRPAFVFDDKKLSDLEKLLAMQATDEEIAAWFGISRKTLFTHRKDDAGLADLYKQGRDKGKASLRRLMWQSACGKPPEIIKDSLGQPIILVDSKGHQHIAMTESREPNVGMQIFLSKNMLGMTDKQEVTGKDGEPLTKPTILVMSDKAKELTEELLKSGGV